MGTWIACVPSSVCTSICFPSPRSIEARLVEESQCLPKPENISELLPMYTIGLGCHRIYH